MVIGNYDQDHDYISIDFGKTTYQIKACRVYPALHTCEVQSSCTSLAKQRKL